MSLAPYGAVIAVTLHVLVELVLIVRVLLRPHREPASRIAWVVVIVALPVVGVLAYIFFGEVNIGQRRVARLRKVLERMPGFPAAAPGDEAYIKANLPQRYEHLFRIGRSISGFEPLGGNSARLLADANAAIDAMVADIDAAEHHVHLLFYIWLPDGNGCKVVEAHLAAVCTRSSFFPPETTRGSWVPRVAVNTPTCSRPG
jgi:cardiolipin synthase